MQQKMTEARKALFLKSLNRHGILAAAARCASPGSDERHGSLSSFKYHASVNPEFAAAVEEALENSRAVVEEELHRRSITGWEEPVFQRGELVGHVTRYSDRLLELRAKALLPNKYIDRKAVEHSGSVSHELMGGRLFIEPRDLLALSGPERETLAGILTKIGLARGELTERPEPVDITPAPKTLEHVPDDDKLSEILS